MRGKTVQKVPLLRSHWTIHAQGWRRHYDKWSQNKYLTESSRFVFWCTINILLNGDEWDKTQMCIPRNTVLRGGSEISLCLEGYISREAAVPSSHLHSKRNFKKARNFVLRDGKGTTDRAASSVLLLVELLWHFYSNTRPPLWGKLPLAHLTLLSRCDLCSICLHLVAQLCKLHWLCTLL